MFSIKTDLAANGGNVLIDKSGLSAALFNLALNSRKAMPNGGLMTIATENRHLKADHVAGADAVALPPGDYVEISVADTGGGMTRETLDRATDPFFTTREVGEGHGLGLSMVLGFIQQSGGTLAVESEVDKGTIVRLVLPTASAEETATTSESTRAIAEPTPLSPVKILLVEDNEAVRQVIAIMARSLGHQVLEAENAIQAPQILADNMDIELMISDVVMPGGKNGIELCQDVSQFRPDLRVILMSGYPLGKLESLGFSDASRLRLLIKPFSKETFLDALQSVLAE